tara:strand:+ start:97 stop:264 length:168 start_codon:yes stop_codon:yes gene_type:complete
MMRNRTLVRYYEEMLDEGRIKKGGPAHTRMQYLYQKIELKKGVQNDNKKETSSKT